MTAPSAAPGGEVVLYEASDRELRLEVRRECESVWLTLTGIARLFGRDKSVISRHLRNVFVSGELERDSAVAKNATVQREGDREVDEILAAVEQTFGGEPLYPSAEARAAHLLYFVIQDHAFSDGNKRIGALLGRDRAPRFADNALVALALLTAEREPAQKGLMVRLTNNLLVDPGPRA